ncbi:unnamed protein product [Somion occarium]|uniref:FIP-RBD domain-containing protein n=1 Tax=Somion occarium TaxID=3059160 RepID=A0ABP1DTE8_9APHY
MSDDYLRTVMLNRSIAMISMRTNGVSVRHIYSGKSNRGAKVVINKKAPNDNQPTVQAAQAKLNKSPIKLQGSFSRESDARLGTSPGSSLSNEKVAGKPTNAALPQVVRLTQFQPNTSVGTLETPVDDTAMTPSTSKPRDDVVAGTKRSYGGSTFVEGKMVERLAEHTEGSESTPHPSKRQKVDIISGTAQRDSVMIAVSDVYSRRPIPESEPVSSAVARPSTSKLQSDDSGTGKEGDLYTSLPAKNGSLEDGAKPFIDRGHQRTKMGESESRDRAPQVLVNESSTLACASTTNTEHQEFENNREGSRMEADGDLARKLVDLQSALDNERRERTRLQARLEEARQLEAELLKTIDDLKRERKDPIVVSAVMDAFIRISNLTNKPSH